MDVGVEVEQLSKEEETGPEVDPLGVVEECTFECSSRVGWAVESEADEQTDDAPVVRHADVRSH